MEKLYFNSNNYTTPKEKKRKFGDRIVFNTRLYFLLRYFKIVVKCRNLAVKGVYDRFKWAESSSWIFNLLEDVGGKFHVEGLDSVLKDKEPCVFIANHMSTLETMILPSMIAPTKPVTFVVKESLLTFPLFGPVMKSRDPIAVGRINPRDDYKKVMEEGEKLLKEGTSIIIFPQSTRNIEFDQKAFGSLGVKLAAKAGVKVVPIALKTDFWGNSKSPIKDLGPINRDKTIHFKFGEALEIEKRGNEEHKKIIDFIEENLLNWNGEIKKY